MSSIKTLNILTYLFNEINNFFSLDNKDNENILYCNYFNIDEIQTLDKLNHKGILSLFHIKKCYLPKNVEDIEYFSDKAKIYVDVIAISKSRIMKKRSPINYINLKNYSHMNRTPLSFSYWFSFRH